ncbi:hypothetical protein DL96DRAFT_1605505 [Flagelloscypha sp. PMI_526]|nr:hypothetical protein DL96DRAFT_1605505 [Flagelloscypha sp. PMI_526]
MTLRSPLSSSPSSPASGSSPLPSAMHHPSHTHFHPTTAAGYRPKVSFSTLDNPQATMFSVTLSVKSKSYNATRATRVYLCAASPDESGREALDWALEMLVQDGDELIVFRGIDQDILDKVDHDVLRDEARDFMKEIQGKSVEYDSERQLSIVLEYVPGKVTDTLDRLIALYRPDSVVVGTRGKRAWSNLTSMGMIGGYGGTMGSVSKYCLSHSPVPVIVVRPERKVRKEIEKRKADPKRGKHFEDFHTPLNSPARFNLPSSGSSSRRDTGPGTPVGSVRALPEPTAESPTSA